jgi:copper chaperone CopZ
VSAAPPARTSEQQDPATEAAPPVNPDLSPVVVPDGLTESSFNVYVMHCANCSTSIEAAVIQVPGVSTVAADWKNGVVKVQYDPGKAKAEDISAAIEKLAFKCKLAEGAAAPDETAAPAQGA